MATCGAIRDGASCEGVAKGGGGGVGGSETSSVEGGKVRPEFEAKFEFAALLFSDGSLLKDICSAGGRLRSLRKLRFSTWSVASVKLPDGVCGHSDGWGSGWRHGESRVCGCEEWGCGLMWDTYQRAQWLPDH